MGSQVRVGAYLLARIKQLGINSIFGVPGDFQLGLLDLLAPSSLRWIGNPNELISAYAADGYSRVNHTPACLITTFGPGELSALNGIAGSFAECVPVVHIVGYPPTPAIKSRAFLHHTLGPNPPYDVYEKMSRGISCASTLLMEKEGADKEIDRVLEAMCKERRPVYIGVPADVCWDLVESRGLERLLKTGVDPNDKDVEETFVMEARERLREAKTGAAIVVDAGAIRHEVLQQTKELVEVTGLSFFTTAMSKGALSEKHPRFGGFYGGMFSKQGVRETLEGADVVLWIGSFPSDLNTGAFTMKVDPAKVIGFERFHVMLGDKKLDLRMDSALKGLVRSLQQKPLKIAGGQDTAISCKSVSDVLPKRSKEITQEWYWTRCGSFFQEKDLIITETGTTATGMNDARLPNGAMLFTQTVWGSIGYATGAAVGAFIAARERGEEYNRCLLFTGEGSLQMVIQALSDLVRFGVRPIIFVLNNSGYTIERCIHGKEAIYNDVPNWKYTEMMNVFAPDYESKSHQVRTSDEVDRLFEDPEFNACKVPQLVEIFMDPLDAPFLLKIGGPMANPFKPRPGDQGQPVPKALLKSNL